MCSNFFRPPGREKLLHMRIHALQMTSIQNDNFADIY